MKVVLHTSDRDDDGLAFVIARQGNADVAVWPLMRNPRGRVPRWQISKDACPTALYSAARY